MLKVRARGGKGGVRLTAVNFASTSQTVRPTLNQGGRGGRCEVAGVVLVCDVVCVHCVRFHLRNCFRLLSEKVTSSALPVSALHRVAMPDLPPRMSTEEKRLVRSMHFDKGMTPSKIASATGRHICSVCRLLAQRRDPAPVGRPAALTVQQIDRLERILNDMIDKAETSSLRVLEERVPAVFLHAYTMWRARAYVVSCVCLLASARCHRTLPSR